MEISSILPPAIESALSQVFDEVDTDGAPGIENHALFICRRDRFAPVLHVRQARVQDHDDLTPIFDRQSDMLSNTYGNFFLAELIEAQDDSMHCLVSEASVSRMFLMIIIITMILVTIIIMFLSL